MSPGERVMMAAVALVAGALLVDGLRTREMTGEYSDYSAGGQPIQFGLAAFGYGLAFVFSALFALGFGTQDFWRWAGWLTAAP